MKPIFLSIIVPVYNVEKYLRTCLDSIIKTEFQDYEIILVTGGSTDKSDIICSEYERINECIIIEQSGKGLSNARNCGLKVAKGEYIIYIDSDDYINTNAFDRTIKKICDLKDKMFDVLITDFFLVDKNNKIISSRRQIEESEDIIQEYAYLKKFLQTKYNYWNVWRYIYRRAFLIEKGLFSKENYKCEDIDYSTKVLLSTKNICFYHNPYYCYRIRRTGSLVNVINMQNIDNLMEILDESIYKININKDFPYQRILIDKLLNEYIFSTALIYDIEKMQRVEAIKKISCRTHLFKNGNIGHYKYWVIRFIGIKNFGFFIYLARQIRRNLSN